MKDNIQFKKHSGIYTLTSEHWLPIRIEEAWSFFSSPDNLSVITPEHMGFNITSGRPDKMYPGQIISYKISPFPGIKLDWVTEITHVLEHEFFVDEQRFGPYAMWHHEHRFIPSNSGTLMIDKVSYKLPLGFIGRLVHPLLVKNQLKKIFTYRTDKLNQIFSAQAVAV